MAGRQRNHFELVTSTTSNGSYIMYAKLLNETKYTLNRQT